jgi:hypothetical protein
MVPAVKPARVPKRNESRIVAIDVANVISAYSLIFQSPVRW